VDFGHLWTEGVGYARHRNRQKEVIEVRTLPTTMIRVPAPFAPLFSKRVFLHVQLLLTGSILAPGKRTVASALRAVGLDKEKRYCRYHRVLSRASWSTREASRLLLGLLVEAFVPDGSLVVGVDGTLERRQGKKIAPKGIYRDIRSDPATPTSSRRVLLGGFAWRCWFRFHRPLRFGRCPSFRHWPLPNATQKSEESDIRSLPSGPSNCFCR
jgi:hypothetical protein